MTEFFPFLRHQKWIQNFGSASGVALEIGMFWSPILSTKSVSKISAALPWTLMGEYLHPLWQGFAIRQCVRTHARDYCVVRRDLRSQAILSTQPAHQQLTCVDIVQLNLKCIVSAERDMYKGSKLTRVADILVEVHISQM